ncbi:hypothetical protein FHS85_003471 [Rhodoligotrophos appendicifer]
MRRRLDRDDIESRVFWCIEAGVATLTLLGFSAAAAAMVF